MGEAVNFDGLAPGFTSLSATTHFLWRLYLFFSCFIFFSVLDVFVFSGNKPAIFFKEQTNTRAR